MGLIRYLMSGDSRRSLKKLNKEALAVEALAPKYEKMTDAELQSQTGILKERLKKGETIDPTRSPRSERRAAVCSA